MELIIDEKLKQKHWNEKDRISAIYIITNLVNNKKYVGQTSNVRKRFSDYNGTKYLTMKTPIFRAIKKYGSDSFTFEVIECPKKSLDDMESFYIEELKTSDENYGYNRSKGADGSTRLKSVRKKLSKAHTGMKESAETKRKKSNTVIMINDELNIVIISDSGKLCGDYLGVSKDYIKNCLRQPSSIQGFRVYYDDSNKRTEILNKMYKKRSIRDKKYVEYAEYLNSIESESVETIYDLIKKKFGKIYKLSYDNKSVSLVPYELECLTEVTDDNIEKLHDEYIKDESKDSCL